MSVVDQPEGRPEATERALSRMFERISAGVYVGMLGADHDLTFAANPHLRLILGYPVEAPHAEVRPFDPSRFLDPQARASLVERLQRDQSVADYLLRVRRVDGTPIWLDVTAYAGGPSADGMMPLQALIRDVSDRKRLEDQARDLYHQLLQAEKLAALGQTVSGVAHELNNPLATILTWAEGLSKRPCDDTTRRAVETILSEAERAARIVRSLLTFARKRHTTRAIVDLNHIVRETLALRAYEQRVTNVSVIEALASGLPPVFADAHQLQQVLLNLVINAEQAMLSLNGRGTLVVRTWHDPDADSVVIEVNDDGPGVAEEARPKIFDPFFTTKEVGKGTGLGLTVAYAIVQEHGGRLWFESFPERGASFYVALPVTGASIRQAAPLPQPAPIASGLSVLLVEDEPALAAAVVEALADAGFKVDHAGDGEEALACVRRSNYDLIVCDLKMPRLDGMQFHKAIATSSPGLSKKMIFVTGDVIGAEAEQFLTESGCRWLTKPFRLADLLRVAREVTG
jgi:two-component system, cell cycle sensor histidine kinase and response regulator CckA